MSLVIYTKSTDPKTNSNTYTCVRPFGVNGLVRVKQVWKDIHSNSGIKLVIKSRKFESGDHLESFLQLEARVYSPKYNNPPVETPWAIDDFQIDDIFSVKSIDENTQTRIEHRRTDNRITIYINEPGEYTLTIPDTADLETNLGNVNIDYQSSHKTWLQVKCKHVNYCGSSGSCGGDKESWTYYTYGLQTDPRTNLKTKGKIMLPHH
jgi:hypothetical protein